MSVDRELESLAILIEAILRCFSRQTPTERYTVFMEAALDRFIREEVRSLTPKMLADKFTTPRKTINHFLSYLEKIHSMAGNRTAPMVAA